MTNAVQSTSSLILLIGLLIAAAVAVRAFLDRTYVPALVGFIGLGILLRLADDRFDLLSEDGHAAFDILAELGIVALLFRVGLESDIAGLRRQLGSASLVWLGNILLSAVPGYFVMSWLLGYDQIPSLIAAVALTATSIGVSVGMWQQHDALGTPKGQLLTDVAELDDLSGLALMVMLFAIVPILHETVAGAEGNRPGANGHGSGGGIWSQLLSTGGILLAKFLGFGALCVAFARHLEKPMTRAFEGYATRSETIVFVAGIGIAIAGVSAWLGFSAAVGALFAGLAFSRDPDAVKFDTGFTGLYHLFTPFFFIGIGLSLEPAAFASALGAGAALAAVAVAGKVVGAGLPALVATGATGAALIGVSMVPRAEITMIIMERGQRLGDWAVPDDLYAAFVLVSAITCLVAPVSLEVMFRRWPAQIGRARKSEKKAE
ncbi:cation:proton antiporter [Rhodovulum sp. 12E13]|uniref:cation:proton antiporter n=1 Tax=Rhodovulum sp. 12E13 TaxID=2203891 RepID=UPI000E15E86B|nr:cation:proton antiporter [Rhodovulum sp. 12E13]RDC72334.1 cation:proton antiporter [Rhodovulum sp. 12E13]